MNDDFFVVFMKKGMHYADFLYLCSRKMNQ